MVSSNAAAVKIKINGQMCQIFWTLSDQHFGSGCCVESKLKGVAEMEAEKPVRRLL